MSDDTMAARPALPSTADSAQVAPAAQVPSFSPLPADRRLALEQLVWQLLAAESVSDHEGPLADAIERFLRAQPHLEVFRQGDSLVARTHLGRSKRVIIAGHIDTVPIIDNYPPRWLDPADAAVLPAVRSQAQGDKVLWGRGATDMKPSVAAFLRLAACLKESRYDVTYVFYDHEEVAAEKNGLRQLVEAHPSWIQGDFAIVGEPTSCGIEAGCNGSIRFDLITRGVAAHSARAWMGSNAIHKAADILNKLNAYQPQTVTVDGLDYREGLNATLISGGRGTNVIPDECRVHVNYRFAPSKALAQAEESLLGAGGLFEGYEYELRDESEPARPGMVTPMAVSLSRFVEARTGKKPLAKLGWTDVARFSQLGIPAVNFGAGDPLLAHKQDEQIALAELVEYDEILTDWLS